MTVGAKPKRCLAWFRTFVPYLVSVALPAVMLFVYSLRYHEPWRDEIQALLIGRDVRFSELFHALRLEGTPPFYHLLIKLLCAAFPAPVALVFAATLGYAALLAGTLHLLVVISRRRIASVCVMFALAGTNIYAYELGVVSRPYGLGLGLVLAGIAELVVAHKLARPRRVLAGALFCGFAAVTSAHAACVAGSALAAFVITEIVCRRSIRPVLPTLAALPFFCVTWVLIAPYAERTPEVATAANPHLSGALREIGAILENGALVPGWWVDIFAPTFWNYPIFIMFTIAMILIAIVRVDERQRDRAVSLFALGMVGLSWLTLLYIFVAWYTGGARHHVYLWLPGLVITLGWLLDMRPLRRRLHLLLAAASFLLLGPWFSFQYLMAWEDLAGDFHGRFTDTKAIAALLPKDAHVVADHDYSIVGLHLWRDDLTLRSPDGLGRQFKHIVVDRDWHKRIDFERAVRKTCFVAPDRTMLVHNSVPLGSLANCLQLVRPGNALVVTEDSDLYRVDCNCVKQ